MSIGRVKSACLAVSFAGAVLTLGAGSADAVPPAADCGPAAGQSARVVNFSTSTCAEAVDTINRFSANGGAADQIGPWACHGIDPGTARKLGYTVECLSGTGRLVLAQT